MATEPAAHTRSDRRARARTGARRGRRPKTTAPATARRRGDAAASGRRSRSSGSLLIVIPLLFLALVSTVFGMMMAVAHELPSLENAAEFRAAPQLDAACPPAAGRRSRG